MSSHTIKRACRHSCSNKKSCLHKCCTLGKNVIQKSTGLSSPRKQIILEECIRNELVGDVCGLVLEYAKEESIYVLSDDFTLEVYQPSSNQWISQTLPVKWHSIYSNQIILNVNDQILLWDQSGSTLYINTIDGRWLKEKNWRFNEMYNYEHWVSYGNLMFGMTWRTKSPVLFNFNTGHIENLPQLPSPYSTCTIMTRSSIFVAYVYKMYRLDYVGAISNKWIELAKIHSIEYAMSLLDSHHILLSGGQIRGISIFDVIATANCQIYDITDNAWESTVPLNQPRYGHSQVTANGLIYVLGGQESNGDLTDSVEVYHPVENKWLYVTNLPQPISISAAISIMDV